MLIEIFFAYYMLEINSFESNVGPKQIKEHLNLYFQCCSVTINSKNGFNYYRNFS